MKDISTVRYQPQRLVGVGGHRRGSGRGVLSLGRERQTRSFPAVAPPLEAEVMGYIFFVGLFHSLSQPGFIPCAPDPAHRLGTLFIPSSPASVPHRRRCSLGLRWANMHQPLAQLRIITSPFRQTHMVLSSPSIRTPICTVGTRLPHSVSTGTAAQIAWPSRIRDRRETFLQSVPTKAS